MNKNQEILTALRKEFADGKYDMGTQFPSEHALMRRFRVSRITINKVTEQLVDAGFLERRGQGRGTYVLNPHPFPLGHFAYICPSNAFFLNIQIGLQRCLFQEGYALDIFFPEIQDFNFCMDCVLHSKYKGIFTSGTGKLTDTTRIPIIYIDMGESYGNGYYTVVNTNYDGAYEMMNTLIAKGHRNVIVFSTAGKFVEDNRLARLKGFSDAMLANGIKDANARVLNYPKGLTDLSFQDIISSIMDKFKTLTAIATDSDHDAFRIFKVLKKLGLEKNICITGFGNIREISEYCLFPSVEQFPKELGRIAALKMLSICNGSDNGQRQVEVKTQLVNINSIPQV